MLLRCGHGSCRGERKGTRCQDVAAAGSVVWGDRLDMGVPEEEVAC